MRRLALREVRNALSMLVFCINFRRERRGLIGELMVNFSIANSEHVTR